MGVDTWTRQVSAQQSSGIRAIQISLVDSIGIVISPIHVISPVDMSTTV